MDNHEIDQLMKTIAISMAMMIKRPERREKAAYWHGYLNALTEQCVLVEKERTDILFWMSGIKKQKHWQQEANKEYLLFHYCSICNAGAERDG